MKLKVVIDVGPQTMSFLTEHNLGKPSDILDLVARVMRRKTEPCIIEEGNQALDVQLP